VLEKTEFERWIKASHAMFEIFEGRFDAYPLAVTRIEEWFNLGQFTIQDEHKDRILALQKNFDYSVYGVTGQLREIIDKQFKSLVENHLKEGQSKNAGFAVSPYLFTWNFRRFKEYFTKRRDFSLELYFSKLGGFFEVEKEKLQSFREKKLLCDHIEKEQVTTIFEGLNSELKGLGINQNEPIGTAKLLHICSPFYFPLIDNDIGVATGLLHSYYIGRRRMQETLTSAHYLQLMHGLKSWLQSYIPIIERIESDYSSSILKLVDEGLYMMSTVKQQTRVTRLGLKV
jgi:hypothetical protein